VLRNALNVAVAWDLTARNVVLKVEAPKVEPYEATILTPAQARQLLAAAKGNRFEAFWLVALSLGLREGEVLGLRWKDVDFTNHTITVAGALKLVDGRPAMGGTKHPRARRTLPLVPSLANALRDHRTRQLEAKLVAGSRWTRTTWYLPRRSARRCLRPTSSGPSASCLSAPSCRTSAFMTSATRAPRSWPRKAFRRVSRWRSSATARS